MPHLATTLCNLCNLRHCHLRDGLASFTRGGTRFVPTGCWNLGQHPESLGARDGLADVYLARGDTAEAIAQLRKADTVARASGGNLPEELREKLAQLQGRRRPEG